MANGSQTHDGVPENLRKQLAVAVRSVQWSYAIFWSLSTTQQGYYLSSVFVYHFLSSFSHGVSFPPTSIYYSRANLVSLLPHQGLYRYLESTVNDHLLSLALDKCYPKWELSFKASSD